MNSQHESHRTLPFLFIIVLQLTCVGPYDYYNAPPKFQNDSLRMNQVALIESLYIQELDVYVYENRPVIFHIQTGPENLSVSENVISWIPSYNDVGTHYLEVIAENDRNYADTFSWTIHTVNPWIPGPDEPLQSLGSMRRIKADDCCFAMSIQDYYLDAHRVTFTYDFYIDTTEITVEQYNAIFNPDSLPGDSLGHLPVTVCWMDAIKFCNERSKQAGLDTVYSYSEYSFRDNCGRDMTGYTFHYFDRIGYRLPTEAEWEYACRAGTITRSFWASDSFQIYCWVGANSDRSAHPVSQKSPNRYGLYDMIGNAAEWCSDPFDKSYYADSPLYDPPGPSTGDHGVIRGGDYKADAYSLGSGKRYSALRTYSEGFRCVLPISKPRVVP